MSTSAVSVRRQAQHEAVSPSLIHRWRQRGMPADIEAGSEWRKRNTARRAGNPGPQALTDTQPPSDPPPAITAAPAASTRPEMTEEERAAMELADQPEDLIRGTIEVRDSLVAVRKVRKFCESKAAECSRKGDDAMSRQWIQTLQSMLARQANLEDRFRDALERDKITLSLPAAERTYRGVFQDIRQKLLAAPAALAARLNPQDPPHAMAVLEEYLQKTVFREIYEATN